MSEIQVGQINSTDGSTAITTGADGYVSFAKTQIGGRRNLIINGAMQVAQRGTSTSITAQGTYFSPDRFEIGITATDQLAATLSQSTVSPDGFGNSLKFDVTTAETAIDADELVTIRQKFEGQDLQGIAKGTSSAKQVTLSFWVRSGTTGTYIAELYDNDNTRQISKAYTINTADTWEHKTITFPADTTGAFDNDNNLSLWCFWWLAAGSNYTSGTLNDSAWASVTNANRVVGQTNLVATTSDFYITGVQLEVGTVATPFEHRSFGEELAACQRYFCKSYNYEIAPGASLSVDNLEGANSTAGGTTGTNRPFWAGGPFPVTMRDAPTVTLYNVDGTTGKITGGSFAKRDGTAVNIGQRSFNVYNNSGATADEDHYCIFTAQSEL